MASNAILKKKSHFYHVVAYVLFKSSDFDMNLP